MNNIKTKPNLMSLIISILLILLAISGIVGFFFISDLSVKIFIMILSILFIAFGTMILTGSILNYEEIINDKFIAHRMNKSKTVLISDIAYIEFHGSYLRVIDKNDLEVCKISSAKANLMPLLQIFIDRGIEILDFLEK